MPQRLQQLRRQRARARIIAGGKADPCASRNRHAAGLEKRAVLVGMERAVREMKDAIRAAQA